MAYVLGVDYLPAYSRSTTLNGGQGFDSAQVVESLPGFLGNNLDVVKAHLFGAGYNTAALITRFSQYARLPSANGGYNSVQIFPPPAGTTAASQYAYPSIMLVADPTKTNKIVDAFVIRPLGQSIAIDDDHDVAGQIAVGAYAVAGIAASYFTGGAAAPYFAAGTATVQVSQGNNQGAVLSALSAISGGIAGAAATGVSSAAQTAAATADLSADLSTGVTAVDEDFFDAADLAADSNPFDSFNFSSGEAYASFSDAQWTDFGLGTLSPGQIYDPNAVTGFGTDPLTGQSVSVLNNNVFDYNATPEVLTNDFGTTFDGPLADPGASGGSTWTSPVNPETAIGAAKIAVGATGGGANPNPAASAASAGAAGSKAAAQLGGSNDVLATIGKVFSTGVAAVGGVASQITTAQPRTYSGQLGPSGGSTVGLPASITANLPLIAAGLIGLAIFMHLSGK